ncbi:MAG TPA: hypothetical protein VF177_17805 [Anaerolineae bacterium]
MTQSAVYATKDKESVATKRRWEQMGAAGGIAFVVMQLAGQSLIQVGGAEPAFDAAATEIETFFMNRNFQLTLIGGFLSVLSTIAFFWFLGALWARLRRYEGEPGWLSLVAFASGLAGVATLLGDGGWELAILRLSEGLEAETIQLLFDQGNFTLASFWVALATMLLATGVVAIRDGALPRWLGWFALVVAVALLAARAVWFTGSGIKFMPYVLFWVWLIATSIVLIGRARGATG